MRAPASARRADSNRRRAASSMVLTLESWFIPRLPQGKILPRGAAGRMRMRRRGAPGLKLRLVLQLPRQPRLKILENPPHRPFRAAEPVGDLLVRHVLQLQLQDPPLLLVEGLQEVAELV